MLVDLAVSVSHCGVNIAEFSNTVITIEQYILVCLSGTLKGLINDKNEGEKSGDTLL